MTGETQRLTSTRIHHECIVLSRQCGCTYSTHTHTHGRSVVGGCGGGGAECTETPFAVGCGALDAFFVDVVCDCTYIYIYVCVSVIIDVWYISLTIVHTYTHSLSPTHTFITTHTNSPIHTPFLTHTLFLIHIHSPILASSALVGVSSQRLQRQ